MNNLAIIIVCVEKQNVTKNQKEGFNRDLIMLS